MSEDDPARAAGLKRFGLLAALAASRPAVADALIERMRERAAATRAGVDGPTGAAARFGAAGAADSGGSDTDNDLGAGPGRGLGRAAGRGFGQGLVARAEPPVVLPPGVSLKRDLPYGSDAAQRLDVYHAGTIDPAGSAPVILYAHGGGWRRGDKAMPQMVRHKMPHWVGRGAVFVSTNYRLLPSAGPLEQAEDLARALAFVQRQAPAWGGDPARVVLVGHSAGAHLTALLAADPGIAERRGATPWLATVAMDSAALDMVSIMSRPHYPFYDPVFGNDPAFWAEASPFHRLLGRPASPMLLVCSSLRNDSSHAAQLFADKAIALGGDVSVLAVPLTHLQINDSLGLPGDYTHAVDQFLTRVGALG